MTVASPEQRGSYPDPVARLFNGDARYCAWKTELRNGRKTKVPYRSATSMGASNDPTTWITRAEAERLFKTAGMDGVGVYLGEVDGGQILAGIDLDTCRDPNTGARAPWANEVITRFATYAEVSPSWKGYKLYFLIAANDRDRALALLDRGNGERGAQWKARAKGEHPPAIELYTSGRYFAVTGKRLPECPDEIRTASIEVLEWLIRDHGPQFKRSFQEDAEHDLLGAKQSDPGDVKGPGDADLASRGARQLDRLRERGKSWPNLAALLNGDTRHLGDDKSRSARDFALVGFAKDCGLSKEEARAVLYAFPHGAGRSRHDSGDRRYFDRSWNRVRAVPRTDADGSAGKSDHERLRNQISDLLSEDAAALQFAALYCDKLRFDHDAGVWREWDGAYWRTDRTSRAFHFARELSRNLALDGSMSAQLRGGKSAFAQGVERFARADPTLARLSDDWDKDPFILGTPAGAVDLRSGAVVPPDPAFGITRITSVAPADIADCPTWLNFLADATGRDPDLERFLQRWAGYCLTGDTREHALVFVHGPGGNGKSVFLNTVAAIMGDYACTAAMDTFEASKSGKHPTDLAMLRGARMVTASETEEGRAWAEARIKQMTGGDPITARFMRQDFFTYRPSFKLTIIGNHQPVLHNVDEAARRRFNIVPFLHKPLNPDKELAAKLAAEFPAILRWMIDGCLDWQANGLDQPAVVRKATEEYFSDQDLFAQWLEERCEVAIGNEYRTEATSALFKSWRAYAEQAGENPGSAKAFSQQMVRRGFPRKREGARRLFKFVALRVEQQDRENDR